MVRPTSKPRLPELVPDAEALAFTRAVFEHHRAVLSGLCGVALSSVKATPDATLKQTRVYRLVRETAAFAVYGEALAHSMAEILAKLEALVTSPLGRSSELAVILDGVDPDDEVSPIRLILAGAIARERVEQRKQLITSSQLAILAGMTRRNVGAVIREGGLMVEAEGRRGTGGAALIRPVEARRWLALRGIAGFV